VRRAPAGALTVDRASERLAEIQQAGEPLEVIEGEGLQRGAPVPAEGHDHGALDGPAASVTT
jgi:hypothetical protein